MKAKIIVFLLLLLFVSTARPVYIEPFPDRFGSLTIDGTTASFGDGTNDFTLTFDGGNDGILKWWEDEETLSLQIGGADLFESYESHAAFSINDKSDETAKNRIGFNCKIEATAAPLNYLAGFLGGYRDSGSSAPNLTGKTVYGCSGTNYFNATNARTISNLYAGWFANYIEGTSNNLTVTNAYGLYSKPVDICDNFSTSNLDVTNSYGVYIENAESDGFANAVIVNNYGLYIADIDYATTINRAIYSAGGDSVHAGNFRFGGTTAPTATIDITGNQIITAAADDIGLNISGTAPAIGVDACDVLYVSGPAGGPGDKGVVGGAGSDIIFISGAGGAGSATDSSGDGGDITFTPGSAGADGGGGVGADGFVLLDGDANIADSLVVDTDTLVVDAVNHRVGIGTSSPNSIFHIKANIPGTVGSHPAGQIIIQNPADSVVSNVVITAYESDGNGNPDQQLWYLGSASGSNSDITFLNRRNAELNLGTNGVSRVTILGNGNVGIGEAAPQDKLEVNGTALFKGAVKYTQDDGNEFISGAVADGYMDYGATTGHRFDNNVNVTGNVEVLGVVTPTTDVMYPVKTVVKTIDVNDDDASDDFRFDNDVADQAEQPVDLGAIIPAYAEVVSVQLRCFETVTSSGAMSIDLGTASGGAELLAAANIDTANDIDGTATGASPKLEAANAAKNVWINATPGANWNTLSEGRWAVMVTYIDYGAVYTWKNP